MPGISAQSGVAPCGAGNSSASCSGADASVGTGQHDFVSYLPLELQALASDPISPAEFSAAARIVNDWWSADTTFSFCGRVCSVTWDGLENHAFALRSNTATRGQRIGGAIDAASIIVPIGGPIKAVTAGTVATYRLSGQIPLKLRTVLGSAADVSRYRGQSGYNVLEMNYDLPLDVRKRLNVEWLDEAIDRGDEIILVTNPVKWEAFMREIGKRSFYNDIELPHLLERKVLDKVTTQY